MEGGAMRGMFTCGVIDTLMRDHITFDGAIGVSAGAVFGCNYKSKQIGRAIRYNMRFCKDKRYCSFSSLRRSGDLYGADFCYRQLPYELDWFDTDTFQSNPMEFWVVCTDADTGEAAYHQCITGNGEDMKWFQASASMPVFSRPVLIGGHRYFDGGCADSIPLGKAEQMGYDRNLVILTQPRGYRKQKSRLLPAISLLLQRYPAIIRDLEGRAEQYNRTLDEIDKKADRGELYAVYPPEALGVGSIEKDPEELQRVYRLGETTAKAQLQQIRQFLTKQPINGTLCM